MNPKTRQNLKNSIEDLSLTVASLKSSARTADDILTDNSIKIDTAMTNFADRESKPEAIFRKVNEIELEKMSD